VYRHFSSPESSIARPSTPRLRPFARVILCFLFGAAATVLPTLENLHDSIWVANGVLLSYLLLSPRSRWPAYLFAGFAAQCAGGLVVKPASWAIMLVLAALNLAEVLAGACLLRGPTCRLPAFTNLRYVMRFVAWAVVTAPLAAGILFAIIAHLWIHLAFGPVLRDWFLTDALGMAVTVPAVSAVFRARLGGIPENRRDFALLVLLGLSVPFLFSQTQVPAMALIFPLLVLIELRMGLGWASLATLFVAAVGSLLALPAANPPQAAIPIGSVGPSLRIQLFVASAMFTLYSISVVVDSLRAAQKKLQQIVYLHDLVTRNSRDVIIVADFKGHRQYVSASASDYLGWTPQQLLQLNSLDLVHPEDRPRATALVQQLHAGLDGALLECRAATMDGNYLWVEASLRTIRDPATGAPTGILNMVRDISARKRAEQELQAAYRAVEELAIIDPLTGLANRRRFDECLSTEWRRGLREREPLSLILIDVDLFKSYNDTYGHIRGDSCLKQIAESAMDVVTRPGDLVARFGGEEFAIILPNTDHPGAIKIADDVRASLLGRNLEHTASPHGIVSISAGCATIVPHSGQRCTELLEIADCALYRAKHLGRNTVCGSSDQARIPESPAPLYGSRKIP
jgi:diguanylate cyclase (GGDEF)-like protein/PAS domain S-box-containing protein